MGVRHVKASLHTVWIAVKNGTLKRWWFNTCEIYSRF